MQNHIGDDLARKIIRFMDDELIDGGNGTSSLCKHSNCMRGRKHAIHVILKLMVPPFFELAHRGFGPGAINKDRYPIEEVKKFLRLYLREPIFDKPMYLPFLVGIDKIVLNQTTHGSLLLF